MITLIVVASTLLYIGLGAVTARLAEEIDNDPDGMQFLCGAIWPVFLACVVVYFVATRAGALPYQLTGRLVERRAERKRLPPARAL